MQQQPSSQLAPIVAHPQGPGPVLRPEVRRLFWQGQVGPAFWTVASLFSMGVNVILVIILLVVGKELFSIKQLVSQQLIGGLYSNFQRMDEAHILTTINVKDTIQVEDTIVVNDTIPVVFDLPLQTETTVVLTKNTKITSGKVMLNGTWVTTDIMLPKNTPLDIYLNLTVPVNQMLPVTLNVPVNLQVPVDMDVPVDIPLNQTQLHEPFVGLQQVVSPYHSLLTGLPDSWDEACSRTGGGRLCGWVFAGE